MSNVFDKVAELVTDMTKELEKSLINLVIAGFRWYVHQILGIKFEQEVCM